MKFSPVEILMSVGLFVLAIVFFILSIQSTIEGDDAAATLQSIASLGFGIVDFAYTIETLKLMRSNK